GWNRVGFKFPSNLSCSLISVDGCVVLWLFQVDCTGYMRRTGRLGKACIQESNPHCGTDGVTYGNKCAFCKAVLRSGGKIRLKHMGKC
uniref:Ovomucoid n=1 Tax=Coturnix japonica TaxID=93934 RepID=A0A8C2TL69_COTJA